MSRAEFTRTVQHLALFRQGHRCAMCGTPILELGEAGRASHRYGEIAEAHHIRHAKCGGGNNVQNCVIICWSCHHTAHYGGNYRYRPPAHEQAAPSDFEFYDASTK
ncbi:MAG: HNH endonuclease [Phycisphaerales bacterium]|nr:HNH endonuclease [Phycisphaerales bacterium]